MNTEAFIKEWGRNPSLSKAAHEQCCKLCPSSFGHDPETEDFRKFPVELRKLTLFPCAWRPEKLCRGYIDLMELEKP